MESEFLNRKCSLLKLVTFLLGIFLGLTEAGVLRENAETNFDDNTPRPEVRIPQGTLRGVNLVTYHRRNIFGFKGIPYAQPPVGNLRFRSPAPPINWNGTLDASYDSIQCPQLSGLKFKGNEDCLYLNVYTPQLPVTEEARLLPVMMYLVGGAFRKGHNNSSRYGPSFLLDKDVVLVVPAYRKGVLGYLSTGDEVAPGNYALKDLVRALEWNRDNIRFFGGDPNRVTLMGGSSGAICAHLLTLSPLTNGLFHKYIAASGSALADIAHRPRRVTANDSILLGEYLGCPTDTSKVLVDCLRGVDASQLVRVNAIFDGRYGTTWGPAQEPDVEGALLTDTPWNLVAAGKLRDLPSITSLNRDEGSAQNLMFYNRPDLFEEFLDQIDVSLPEILQYGRSIENVTAYTNALKSYYLNDLTAERTLLLKNFTLLAGDFLFTYPAYRGLQRQVIRGKSAQYFCSFQYRGTLSFSYKTSGGATVGDIVSHGDELLYLFQNPRSLFGPPEAEMNKADWEMVDKMVQLWTSFAIDGKPSILDPNSTVIWEPYSSRKNYLRIGNGFDNSIKAEQNYLEDRMQFWDQLTAATSWK